MSLISSIVAREILDSRGTPTVEVEVELTSGVSGRASVPSGASTGKYEAVELRDGGSRYGGKGVTQAVKNVEQHILPEVKDQDLDQPTLDRIMLDTDGTKNKSKLGANAILGVSLAFAKAVAEEKKVPLWDYFRGLSKTVPTDYIMPVPLMNIINGGKHAADAADLQEFMIVPVGAATFSQALEMGVNVFQALKKVLQTKKFSTAVGDEGGFAPSVATNNEALDLIIEAITAAGYRPGDDVATAIDVAASELYQDGHYVLTREGKTYSTDELITVLEDWTKNYPIVSIEDPLQEDDWQGFTTITSKIGDTVQIVGDDLYVTNVDRLQKGIEAKASNAILIKLNQIGTVTETVQAIDLARQNNMRAIVSHRSGETEDTTIADFVVGLSTGQIKAGSLSRTDRIAKYNQLLRIESALGDKAVYHGQLK
jgi:enolase